LGLLQDPLKAIDQIEWYLDHREMEKFPGAFEIAGGNLCRQVLEQILFILCFFSEMPKDCFFRSDKTLKTAGKLLKAIDKVDPTKGVDFWELARRRGPRIRKFARHPRTLRKWQREFNEPSHYSTRFRKVDQGTIIDFARRTRSWLDEKDKYLLVSALNELNSDGRIQATLSDDEGNTPGICQRTIVSAANLYKTPDGGLAMKGPQQRLVVLPDDEVPRGRWPTAPVLVRGTQDMSIGVQFLTKRGTPVDISNFEGIIRSFSQTRGERAFLVRRMREIGFEVHFEKK